MNMPFTKIAGIILLVSILIQILLWRKRKVPTYFIDLDLEPEERWREIAEKYSYNIKELYDAYIASVSKATNLTYPQIHSICDEFGSKFPEVYQREMTGFSQYAGLNVTVFYFLHMHYEFYTTCTTIVCVDEEENVWMFRSLDYLKKGLIQDATFNADFQRGNRSVFKGTVAAGLIGFPNALRRDQFSISVNRRLSGGTLMENLKIARQQVKSTGTVWPMMLFVRNLMEKEESFRYRDAVLQLRNFPLISPCYFIISGRKKNEGSIITRDRTSIVNQRSLDTEKGRWYLIITNLDYGSKDWKEHGWRYKAANTAMTKMTRSGISEANGFKVLKETKWRRSAFLTVMSVENYVLGAQLI